MNAYLNLFLMMLISIAASLIVLRVLADPLVQVLTKICPDGESAVFWQSYTRIMLVITPLILVLLTDLFAQHGTALGNLRLSLLMALAGLLVGLHMIGARLGRFVAYPERPASPGAAK